MPQEIRFVRKMKGINWKINKCSQCGRRFDSFVDYPYRKIIRMKDGKAFCSDKCREDYFRRR